MRPALTIAVHHLRRLIRRPGLVLVLIAVPVTLAVIEYGAFGGGIAAGKLPPVKVLFLDEDGSFASSFVPQFFSNGSLRDLIATGTVQDRDAAKRMFEKNEAAALIVVPKGFQAALLDGRRAELVLYRNPIQNIGPEIAQGVLEMLELVCNRLYAQAVAPLGQIRTLVNANRNPTADDIAAISRGFFEAGQRLNRLTSLETNTVAVKRPDAAKTTEPSIRSAGDFFATFFPGLVIFALMFLSQSLALGLLRDRLRGLDRRIAMTHASPIAAAAGNVIYLASAMLAALVLLAVLGAALFRIPMRNPIALVGISLGFALFATGLQLVIISATRTDRAAGFMGTALILVLTLLGGSMVPAEQYPPWLRAVSFQLPNGAAQQAFIEVLARQHSLASIAPRLAATWAWAVGTIAVYLWLRRRPVGT